MPRLKQGARVFEPGELVLGKYRVRRVVGAGGMGTVLEAENVHTTRRVAVKVLHPELVARPSTVMKRFLNEARAGACLAHPNSVDVLDLDQDEGGTLFIVQEFLEGESLDARIRREGRLAWREAFDVMLPVMSALAEAHRRGVVHRDVKPDNIFLARPAPGVCVPKVIDFGIARVFNGLDERLTSTDVVVGTPLYMSPEQATGERELDGRTDVWSAAVVLYELLAGVNPFDVGHLKEVLTTIASGDHEPLHARAPDVPAAVADVVERALRRDREDRYPTMDDFLAAALACVGLRAVGVGRLEAVATPGAAAPPEVDAGDAPPPPVEGPTYPPNARTLPPPGPPTMTHPTAEFVAQALPRPDRFVAVAALLAALLVGMGVGIALGAR